MKKQKPILSDHKKRGKKYVPPLLELNLEFVSWRNCVLPELIWLGLINEAHGLKLGAELGLSLARAASEVVAQTNKRWYSFVSSYDILTDEDWAQIIDKLRKNSRLEQIKASLLTLVTLYPECPFRSLFSEDDLLNDLNSDEYKVLIKQFKEFLELFLPKYAPPATLAQANVIYIAFATDRLTVAANASSLADLPLITDYPNTDRSKEVAASVYSTINGIMPIVLSKDYTPWSHYFWNRGLEIEGCDTE